MSEEEAVRLILAMAAEAGRLVRQDAGEYVQSLEVLVAEYIRSPDDRAAVDWEFIGKRTLRHRQTWREEDSERHRRALKALNDASVEPQLSPEEAATLASDA